MFIEYEGITFSVHSWNCWKTTGVLENPAIGNGIILVK